jgi:hypothetical protein
MCIALTPHIASYVEVLDNSKEKQRGKNAGCGKECSRVQIGGFSA